MYLKISASDEAFFEAVPTSAAIESPARKSGGKCLSDGKTWGHHSTVPTQFFEGGLALSNHGDMSSCRTEARRA